MSQFYFSYVGNKRTEMKYIEPYIKLDGISTIVEPFCGSSSFSRFIWLKNGVKFKYHSNDNDKIFIELMNDIKNNGSKKYFEYCTVKCKDLNREIHDKQIKEYKENSNNYNFFYYRKVFNYRIGLFPGRIGINKIYDFDKYLKTDEFYKKCLLTNQDYKEIFKKYKEDEKALLFLDPPYLESSNTYYSNYNEISDSGGTIIDNTIMYIDILNLMNDCKCKIILIINSNSIIKYIYKDYIKKEYYKQYSSTLNLKNKNKNIKKKNTIHLICTNF